MIEEATCPNWQKSAIKVKSQYRQMSVKKLHLETGATPAWESAEDGRWIRQSKTSLPSGYRRHPLFDSNYSHWTIA
jgi:hypothetical protein